jgi:hypothetical protein
VAPAPIAPYDSFNTSLGVAYAAATPTRSVPSYVGHGREEVGSGGGERMVGSSKENRGSGKKSIWLEMRVSRVEGMKMICERY